MKKIAILLILLLAAYAHADDPHVSTGWTASEETAGTGEADPGSEKKISIRYPDINDIFNLYQPYLEHISAYEPIYFLVGTNPEDSKFQFSFKYRLFNPDSPLAERYRFLNGFHFAYTQTSFWDLASSSLPFEDTSYKPEIFHISSNIDTGLSPESGLFIQSGIQHESNGQGGEASRSTNFLYARPVFIYYDEASNFGFMISPKFWLYVDNDEEYNRDLPDYRGYFYLDLMAGKPNGLVLSSNLRWAQKGGSAQFDATYPLHRIHTGISGAYLHIQYVNSLAESLLDYDARNEAIRIGISIVR